MKRRIIIYAFSAFLSGMAVYGQSADRNYVKTCLPPVSMNGGTTFPETGGRTTIQYFDDLGRLQETVEKGATPTRGDLVSYIEYNERGLPSREWLPAPVAGNAGKFVALPAFGTAAKEMYADRRPFSETVYGSLLMNRIEEEIGPGEDWYLPGTDDEPPLGRVSTLHLTNRASGVLAVRYYWISPRYLVKQGNYPPGTLTCVHTTDENGGSSYKFTDSAGRLVLSRTADNRGNTLDTYYIYDKSGNLRHVLPPKAVDLMAADKNYEASAYKHLAYTYNYDDYKRCTSKQLPGCTPMDYIYDKTGRLILMRDGNLKSKQLWRFTIPDRAGRVVLEGTISNRSRISLDSVTVYTEWAGGESGFLNTGYRTPNISMPGAVVSRASYYDGYAFKSLPGFSEAGLDYAMPAELPDKRYGTDSERMKHTGLLTGVKNRILGTARFLHQAVYYDAEGRPVQRVSENHLDGIFRESTAYSFTGEIMRKILYGRTASFGEIKEHYIYSYDHAGRLRTTRHRLNDMPFKVISQLSYDETGRVKNKIPGTLQGTDYTYNVRNWITGINNPSYYSQTNYYTTAPVRTHPVNYNGNISWITHTGLHLSDSGTMDVHTRDLRLQYDKFDRLSVCDMLDSRPEFDTNCEFYTYDKNGNITSLARCYKDCIVDDLYFAYNGNQLTKVSDGGHDVYLSEIPQILCGDHPDAFSYDSNGNLIRDMSRGIDTVRYNELNLPWEISLSEKTARNKYLYLADGTKLQAGYTTELKMVVNPGFSSKNAGLKPGYSLYTETNYAGNCIYKNGVLDKILFDGGYIQYSVRLGQPEYKYYYYIQDQLGSNRVVVAEDGTVVQGADYLPSGIATTEYEGLTADNHLHTGKEFDSMHGLHWYDNGARWMDPIFHRFTTMDPLAEAYYAISPYVHCNNNPLKYSDPTGMYFDEDSEKAAAKIEKQIEKRIKKLLKEMDKVIKKGGDLGDRQARIGELRQSKMDISDMRNSSDTEFRYAKASDKNNPAGQGAPVTSATGTNDKGDNVITMYTESNMGSRIHESRHGGQIAREEYVFDSHGNPTNGYGISSEVSAYRAQYSYSGELIYMDASNALNQRLGSAGIVPPISILTSIYSITPDFVRTKIGEMRSVIVNGKRIHGLVPIYGGLR